MSRMNSATDFPRNEAGLVGEFIGTAYDTVKRVYDNLGEIQRLDGVLDDIDNVAERVTREVIAELQPGYEAALQQYVDAAGREVDKAEEQVALAQAEAEKSAASASEAAEIVSHVSQETELLRSQITSSTDAAYGPGMMPYNGALAYPAGSIGAKMKEMLRGALSAYGVVGDGVADDSDALQAFLDNNLHADFLDSTLKFKLTKPLVLRNGHKLTGQWPEFIQSVSQTPMFDCIGKSNIKVSSLALTGATGEYLNSPASQDIGIKADSVNNIEVVGCKFKNFQYSPMMTSQPGSDIVFAFNIVDGPGASVLNNPEYRNTTGFTLLGQNIRVHGNRIRWTASGGIIGQMSKDVVVSSNVIREIITEHGLYCDSGIVNLSLVSNIIHDTVASGLKVQNYDAMGTESGNVNIIGNVISNVTKGPCILLINTAGRTLKIRGFVVSGNICKNAGVGSLIDVRYSVDGVIANNITVDGAECGLYMEGCENVHASSNLTVRTAFHAAWVINCTGCSLHGNTLVNPNMGQRAAGSGILMAGGSGNDFYTNRVRSDGKMVYGLFIESGDQTSCGIWDNQISGHNGAPIRLVAPAQKLRYIGGNVHSGMIQGLTTELQFGNLGSNGYIGSGPPTSGTFDQGVRIINPYPAPGQYSGWVCVSGGSPGGWRGFGLVAS